MKFSIIIPMYNVENYITESLKSLLLQKYKDFEIVAVDDGSIDNTKGKCEEFKGKNKDINLRYLHQNNSGQYRARQLGIQNAKGEYLLFLDADDYLREDALTILRDEIEKSRADLLIFNAMRFNEKECKKFWPKLCEDRKTFIGDEKRFLYKKIIEGNTLNNLWLKCFKKELVENNPDIDKRVNVEEDLIQFLPVVTNAKKVIYIDEYIYYYRENISSVTARFNINHFYATTYASKEIMKYINKWFEEDYSSLNTVRYINNIYGSVLQLLSKKCDLTKEEKQNYLEKISEDDYFIKSMESYKKTNRWSHKYILFRYIFKRKYFKAMFVGKLILSIR